MDSILKSIKATLGIESIDLSFDDELIIFINSIFSTMQQLGMKYFIVVDDTTLWSSFFESRTDLDFVKTYVGLKVKLLFDPPQNSFLVDNIKKQCEEFEWRISILDN